MKSTFFRQGAFPQHLVRNPGEVGGVGAAAESDDNGGQGAELGLEGYLFTFSLYRDLHGIWMFVTRVV